MDTVGKGGRKHLVVWVTPKPENGWMVSISVWHKRETKCSKCDLMVIQRWSLGVQILLVTAVRTRHKVTHFHFHRHKSNEETTRRAQEDKQVLGQRVVPFMQIVQLIHNYCTR